MTDLLWFFRGYLGLCCDLGGLRFCAGGRVPGLHINGQTLYGEPVYPFTALTFPA